MDHKFAESYAANSSYKAPTKHNACIIIFYFRFTVSVVGFWKRICLPILCKAPCTQTVFYYCVIIIHCKIGESILTASLNLHKQHTVVLWSLFPNCKQKSMLLQQNCLFIGSAIRQNTLPKTRMTSNGMYLILQFSCSEATDFRNQRNTVRFSLQ